MNHYIIKTKLYIPQYRENSISRPALIQKLSEGLSCNMQITLVSAPPGYGKTSLIVEWSKKSHLNFIWLTLDKGDNEPVRFFSYFIAALQQVDKNIGIAALSLLDAPQFPPLDLLAGALVNDITDLPGRAILVLDDFQHINDEFINETLRYFLENQPQNLHMVIISRQDPGISFSKHRARGLINEIREADLRFSHQESLDFIKTTMNLQLTQEQVSVLESRTEGWAAGLQLSALSIQGRDDKALLKFLDEFSGTQRYIIDYLFEEAFAQLPERVKRFLVQTSILDRFCSQLCDELLGRHDSSSVINRISKDNIFISSLDEYGHWYRYHTLFRDILKTELDDDQQKALYMKASIWFEQNGLYDEAISYAIAAQDFDALERLLTKTAWSLIQSGEIRTLYDRIQALPIEWRENSNEIKMYRSWCLLLSGDGKEASRVMNDIDFTELVRYRPEIKANMLILQIFKAVSFKELLPMRLPEQAADFIESDDPVLRTAALYCTAQIKSFQGDLDASVRYYHEAYNNALKARQYFMAVISVKNLSITLLLRGKKTDAMNFCNSRMTQLVDARGKLLPAASILYVPMGMAYYSEDNLDQAYECLEKGISISRKLSLMHFAVQGEMSMALLQFAMHDVKGALKTIYESGRSLKEIGMEIGVPMFTAIEAELYLRNGDLEFARKWADKMGLNCADLSGIIDERQYFTYSRILTVEGKYAEARTILDKLEMLAEEGDRIYRLITVHILKAVNYFKMNRQDLSLDSLERALKLAVPESYFRLFLDEDPCIYPLLIKVRPLAPVFIDILSEKYKREDTVADTQKNNSQKSVSLENKNIPGLLEQLSDRELEVLRLVAAGLPNQEIANRLFISLGTTKWHITNIFSKLRVKNRVQAVEAAKSLILPK